MARQQLGENPYKSRNWRASSVWQITPWCLFPNLEYDLLMARQSGRKKTIADCMNREQRKTTPCLICKLSNNQDKSIFLILHHRDGNRENNDRMNQEFLCTRCHPTRHLRWNKDNGRWEACTSSETILTPSDLLAKLDAREPDGGEFTFWFESQLWKIKSGVAKIALA